VPGKIKQELVDPNILSTGENMWKAIEAGDYEGFVDHGSASFKVAMTRENFQAMVDQLTPRIKGGYEFRFVVERLVTFDEGRQGLRVFLWKIKFADGEGNFNFYLKLKDGLVECIQCHMVWPIDGLAYVTMWMAPPCAGLLFAGEMGPSGGWRLLFAILIGLPVGAAIMFGNIWLLDRIHRAWIEKHQVQLLKKPAVVLVNIAAFAWAFLITGLAALISIYLCLKAVESLRLG